MKKMLYFSLDESVFRIGIRKSEIPYIKKRIEDLGYKDSRLLDEFLDYLDRDDDKGMGELMSGDYSEDYERIRDELLAKRNHRTCPFCKEAVSDLKPHIKEYHKEEVVLVYDELKKSDIDKMRRENILDNLE